ncbi:MAG: hypothetical protein V4697_02750 [Patescibacteria group bacterium]
MNTSTLPSISLWNSQASPILWINDGLNRDRHLSLRGIKDSELRSSFATADRAEAIRRQNLIRLFVENDSLREFVLMDHFARMGSAVRIPADGQQFVNYFNPHEQNEFWTRVEQFEEIVSQIPDFSRSNPALSQMAEHLRTEQVRLESSEAAMGKSVVDQLLKATTLDGTVTLQLRKEEGRWNFATWTKDVVGHRLYALNPPKDKVSIHEFFEHEFFEKIGIYSLLRRREESRIRREIRKWANPIIVTELPNEVLRDICNYMNDILREEGKKEKSLFPFPDESKDGEFVDLVIRFSYNGEGLKIKLVGLSDQQTVPPEFEERWAKPMDEKWSRYYRSDDLEKIDTMQHNLRRRSYITHLLTNYYPRLKQWFAGNFEKLLGSNGMVIPSPASDDQFKWSHGETVCREKWTETYQASKDVREFAADHMYTLLNVAKIANTFVERSRRWQLPLSFPEIVEGEQATLSFDALWPVALIGRKTSGSKGRVIESKDLRPITALGNLAAGISMLTGGNGAGKTTTGEEILGLLHDAASGFPVFGKNVRLNLRTVIGSIYLEHGDGSTMQLSLEKLGAVVTEVANHPMNGTFVFWDEAGTGTTASQGERLGMATLARFRQIGCTVLVNTQIPALAENAQNRLGAKCFKVDMAHTISSGIGEPDIHELAREMGLEKVLNLQKN